MYSYFDSVKNEKIVTRDEKRNCILCLGNENLHQMQTKKFSLPFKVMHRLAVDCLGSKMPKLH